MNRVVVATITLALGLAGTVASQQAPARGKSAAATGPDPILYTETRTTPSTFRDRGPSYAPTYLIYADRQRTRTTRSSSSTQLGMLAHLDEYKARAFVVGPCNGTAYDAAGGSCGVSESAAHAPLVEPQDHRRRRGRDVRQQRHLEVRLRGRGHPHLRRHGGQRRHVVRCRFPATCMRRTRRRQAVHRGERRDRKIDDSAASTTYAIRAPTHGLQRVVVSKLPDAKENLAQAFENAWKTVFSKNYRLYMSRTESYSQGFDPNNYTEPWELEPYVMYDELGVRYEAMTEDLPDLGLSLRYEYVPAKALTAAPKSVPLVIMLHGNMQRPAHSGREQRMGRGRGEAHAHADVRSSGRAARPGTRRLPAIGEAGTMAILDRLLAKYPQIDPSRVYFTGLSAGAMNSFTYGVNNIARIAAVAGSFGAVRTADAARRGGESEGDGPVTCRCIRSPATRTCTSRCR